MTGTDLVTSFCHLLLTVTGGFGFVCFSSLSGPPQLVSYHLSTAIDFVIYFVCSGSYAAIVSDMTVTDFARRGKNRKPLKFYV